jgi:hypothetical protein
MAEYRLEQFFVDHGTEFEEGEIEQQQEPTAANSNDPLVGKKTSPI